MSEEKKTPVNAPEDLNVTEDVIPERLIKTTDEVHTGGETKRIFIPNAADVYVIGQDDERGFFRADAVIIPGETAAAAPTVLTADTQE